MHIQDSVWPVKISVEVLEYDWNPDIEGYEMIGSTSTINGAYSVNEIRVTGSIIYKREKITSTARSTGAFSSPVGVRPQTVRP